jgi:hypothetical protein
MWSSPASVDRGALADDSVVVGVDVVVSARVLDRERRRSLFELNGREHPERRASPLAGLERFDVLEDLVDQLVAGGTERRLTRSFSRVLLALLECQRDLGAVPPAGDPVLSEVEEQLGSYRAWLRSERGVAAVSPRSYRRHDSPVASLCCCKFGAAWAPGVESMRRSPPRGGRLFVSFVADSLEGRG